MDNQPPLPTSPKKSFTWIFIILFLISTGLAGWFYYQNLQLKQQPAPTPSLAVSPQPSIIPSPSTGGQTSWRTAKYGNQFSYEYPADWHVAELWNDTPNQNGVMLAIDPKPISTAPRGGPFATFEITLFAGNTNPDEILQQKIDGFNSSLYYDIIKETINAPIVPVHYFKGKAVGPYAQGEPVESYMFTFRKNPNDLINQYVAVANLTFKDDPQLSEMLRHIVLSFKELQQ